MKKHIVVVGAGAFGGWTAWHCLEKGYRVTLVDAWGGGNSLSSSGDETRVIRSVYTDSIYAEMAQRSAQIWRENEAQFGQKILHTNGVLTMGGTDDTRIRAAIPIFEKLGIDYEELDKKAAAKRHSVHQFGRN